MRRLRIYEDEHAGEPVGVPARREAGNHHERGADRGGEEADSEDAGDVAGVGDYKIVQGSRFKVQGSKFKVQGSKFKVQSSRFKVQSGFKGWKGDGCYCLNGACPHRALF